LFFTANAEFLVKQFPEIRKTIGNFFDVKKLFSNQRIFSVLGKILCGKPFPHTSSIRYVNNILYSPDYAGPDKHELDVMPSETGKLSMLNSTLNFSSSQRHTASSFTSTSPAPTMGKSLGSS
jgi:hypothetical protein